MNDQKSPLCVLWCTGRMASLADLGKNGSELMAADLSYLDGSCASGTDIGRITHRAVIKRESAGQKIAAVGSSGSQLC